jgi:hypothetical protein
MAIKDVRYFLFVTIANNPAMNMLVNLLNISAGSIAKSGIYRSRNMHTISYFEYCQTVIWCRIINQQYEIYNSMSLPILDSSLPFSFSTFQECTGISLTF